MTDWMPHGFCFLWNPIVLSTSVLANFITGSAYIGIALRLYSAYKKLAGAKFFFAKWAFVSFALFIALCGLTHFINIVTIWKPWYFQQVCVEIATALVSITTLWELGPLTDKYISKQIKETNDELLKTKCAN